jgi:hypothetical protein
MGKFSRGLPLFIERSEEFSALVQQISSDVMQTMRHQQISYEDLRRAESLAREAYGGEVPDEIVFRYTAHEELPEEAGPGGLRITHNAFSPRVRYHCDNIGLAVDDFSSAVGLALYFNPRAFPVADADLFTADLTNALGGVPGRAPARDLIPGDAS